MKTSLIPGLLCVVAVLGLGCSKKDNTAVVEAATNAAAPAEATTADSTAGQPTGDGDYDAKVATALRATSGAPLTEAQKEAAHRAEKQLLDSVEKDPKAAEAYKNLQRLRNGR